MRGTVRRDGGESESVRCDAPTTNVHIICTILIVKALIYMVKLWACYVLQ